MVSSNDVPITEHENVAVDLGNGRVVFFAPREYAALRAHFVAGREADYFEGLEEGIKIGRAERMPEDVQKLVDEVLALHPDDEEWMEYGIPVFDEFDSSTARRVGCRRCNHYGHTPEGRACPTRRALLAIRAALEAAYSQKAETKRNTSLRDLYPEPW